MEMTAVVLNAGLGDISFGLQMAGFSIIAAYETDLKAAAVHEANIEAPVFHHLPQKSDLEMISSAAAAPGILPAESFACSAQHSSRKKQGAG